MNRMVHRSQRNSGVNQVSKPNSSKGSKVPGFQGAGSGSGQVEFDLIIYANPGTTSSTPLFRPHFGVHVKYPLMNLYLIKSTFSRSKHVFSSLRLNTCYLKSPVVLLKMPKKNLSNPYFSSCSTKKHVSSISVVKNPHPTPLLQSEVPLLASPPPLVAAVLVAPLAVVTVPPIAVIAW